jgi:hypothetical protein
MVSAAFNCAVLHPPPCHPIQYYSMCKMYTIKSLAPKQSCDVFGTSTKMVKFIGNAIAVPLSHIFNLSLESGKFPTKLKQCRVIPIFKSGNASECDNYRPISLLSSISKVLEKIVAEKLTKHLLSNNLLYQHQYGFLPKRSTEQNLIQIVNFISEAINNNMYCVGVFLDLKKDFDLRHPPHNCPPIPYVCSFPFTT